MKDAYNWYKLHYKSINCGLFCILFILIFIYLFPHYFFTFYNNDIEKLTKFSRFFRDFVYIVAIITAGLWSYYVFIKGRTFEPKARLNIRLKEFSSAHEIAIIRFTVTNIGKVKLTSLQGQVWYFLGLVDNKGIIFVPFFVAHDILQHYYHEPGELLVLEPGDEINIDMPVFIKGFKETILMVKSVFEVSEKRVYKENAIFCLENQGSKL